MTKRDSLLPAEQRKLLMSYRPNTPQRPVDWAWRRLVIYADLDLAFNRHKLIFNQKNHPKKLKAVSEAYGFLRSLQRDVKLDEIADKYPVAYETFFIANETTTTRWAIEAFILAGLDNKEIAQKLGYEDDFGAQVIEAYETLRFDVRSRMEFDAFINEHVLNVTATGQLPSTEDKLWKLFGWLGYKNDMGTTLLDGYMTLNIMPKEIQDWYARFINSHVTRRTTSAIIKMDPVKNPEVMELLKVNNDNRRLEIELEQKAALTDNRELEKAKANLVESISFSLVDLDKIASTGVELQIGQNKDIKQIESKIAEQVKTVEEKRKAERDNKNENND